MKLYGPVQCCYVAAATAAKPGGGGLAFFLPFFLGDETSSHSSSTSMPISLAAIFSSCFCNARARAASSFFVSIAFGGALAVGAIGLTSSDEAEGTDFFLGEAIFDSGAASLVFITPGVTTCVTLPLEALVLVPALASSAEFESFGDFCFIATLDFRPAVSHPPSSDEAAAFAPSLPPSSDRACIIARRSSSLYDVSPSSSVPLSPEATFAGRVCVPVEDFAKDVSLSTTSGLRAVGAGVVFLTRFFFVDLIFLACFGPRLGSGSSSKSSSGSMASGTTLGLFFFPILALFAARFFVGEATRDAPPFRLSLASACRVVLRS
mmetsp:Transcript_23177/g.54835  ORF Transcript_23177/g.54835 Transcript_23177/m.54835 type:complete len:321 (-) Transcript_23177:394-1356(-)